MNWKNKTCETCTFQVDGLCRLNPPIHLDTWTFGKGYPYVYPIFFSSQKKEWIPACARYQEEHV